LERSRVVEEAALSHDSSLEPVLRAVEPAVRLIPERYLLQVLQYLTDWGRPLPTNPNLPYWVSRDDLVAGDLLPPHVMAGTEPELLLVTDPDDRMIDRLPKGEQLRAYWRVLFQAAVTREIDRKVAAGALTQAVCLEKLERFGRAAAREIRYVLQSEHTVAPEADAVGVYRMFAATYLDLAAFAGHGTEVFFPSLPHGEAVSRALAEDVDAARLLAVTRPEGAADPHREPAPDERWEAPEPPAPPPVPPAEPRSLAGRAQEAEQKGNNVRAAILWTQVAAGTTGDERDRALGSARGALGKLVDALGDVFTWDTDTRQEWRQALVPLLDPAAHGVWPRAARCLYELQKIPADLSREVYAVDLPEYLRTFGRRPVKRLLPRARPVLILMSLKKAHAQMLRAGLGDAARLRIDRLFHHQIHQLEHNIRHEFTPVITGALTDAGLVPSNKVEEVGRDKLVAELLDRVCERGYLRIGNLRDAIARNRVKMADLAGPGEFFRGDVLLRADINLAYALDGVYRKGEFYLRWIQRFSSIFFGTYLGRLFTLYIAVPFGGAFLTLMFLEELRHIGSKLATLVSKPAVVAKSTPQSPPQTAQGGGEPQAVETVSADQVEVDDDGNVWIRELNPGTITSDGLTVDDEGNVFWVGSEPGTALVTDVFTSSAAPTATHAEQPHSSFLVAWPTIVGFGVFLLLMFHVPPFRRAVFALLGYLWWAVRGILWDIPVGLWRSPTLRGFRQSRPVRFFVRHFWSPLLITLLVFAAMLLVVSPWFLFRWWWAIWAALTIAYNTPWGWVIQDWVAEKVSDWWRVVRVNLIPGLIAAIIDWFKMLANWVERQLYAVDEWLRFRGGDSQGSLAMKAVLGLLWFPIAYTFRFVFYLLVEPQVNPVKHFPVVTVSHKVIWPMVPQLSAMTGISVWTVSMIVNGIPGIFGFIAWELKENWRLYRANRSPKLRPVMLGSHGESMRGLLRPGFHSGTVPKLFRKLRHAEHAKASWLHHDLDHAAEGIHRFAERELVELLPHSPDWGTLRLGVGAVRFGCQRVTLELLAPSLGRDPFVLAFENVGGKIEAAVEQVGWADKLTEPQRGAFVAALRGMFDMAAVERIDGRERVEGTTPLGPGFADLARRVTWAEWVERWDGPTDAVSREPQANASSSHRSAV
jgi:hypothetical protein